MPHRMTDHIEGAFVIGCSRCANEGSSYTPTADEAEVEFRARGWTYTGNRVYCPDCSNELR